MRKFAFSLALLASLSQAIALAAIGADRPFHFNIPLFFEQHGHSFLARGAGSTLRVGPASTLLLDGSGSIRGKVQLLGTRPQASGHAMDRLASRSNYFLGARNSWRSNITHYAKVRFDSIYRGIDVVYYGNDGRLEYDFVAAPGADLKDIEFCLHDEAAVRIENGDLVASNGSGDFRLKAPIAYQMVSGIRHQIDASYEIRGSNRVGFRIGAYDKGRELVIDPVLVFATYLGGSRSDSVTSVARDGAGNLYVTGMTQSVNFPLSANAPYTSNTGSGDAFVTKYSPTGTVLYSTYIGGTGGDLPSGIAVDASGNAWIAGFTESTNFPLASPLQTSNRGGDLGLDGFVTKLNAAGSQILFSTYLGGNNDELVSGVALDSTGNAYVTGATASMNFAVTLGAYQNALKGLLNGFVTKFTSTGSAISYSTYVGGSVTDFPSGIAVDSSGNAYIAGDTTSSNYPVTQNAFQTNNRGGASVGTDAYVTKLNAGGSQLLYSTFLGGTGDEVTTGVAFDTAGNIYVCGRSESVDYPATAGAVSRQLGGTEDAFVAKFSGATGAIVFSTLLGGNRRDRATSIRADASGNAYVGGMTTSPNFPVNLASQPALNGTSDGFVAMLNPLGTSLLQATYIGGSGSESLDTIEIDAAGNVYVAGSTDSSDIAVTTDAPQKVNAGGGSDVFVAKLSFSASAQLLTVTPQQLSFAGTVAGTVTAQKLSISGEAGSRTPWLLESVTASGGNWLTVSPRSGTGVAQVDVLVNVAGMQAGQFTGTITLVNQGNNTRTAVPVTLVLTASGGQIPQNGIVNGASFAGSAVAAGEIITIFGTAIGPTDLVGLKLTSAGLVDTVLAETRVLFDGVPAPLLYVSATQTSAIVPYAVAGKTSTQMQVELRGTRSNVVNLPVAEASPALFTLNATGRGPAAALNANYERITPASPAPRGSIVIFFGTGEGQTDPGGVDGLPANSALPKPRLQVSMTIGGVPAEILYSGAAPGLVAGMLQINARIPDEVTPGPDLPVIVTVGSVSSPATATIAVQ